MTRNKYIFTNVMQSEPCVQTKLVQGQPKLNVYNILVIPPFLYGCKIRTLKQRNTRKLKRADIEFMRCTAGYNLSDHTGNEERAQANPVKNKIITI
jgi:hypothetical protein